MLQNGSHISANSRRIAKNTLLLYFRMLLMMVIGLFTYRVVIRTLGITDYGVYNAVGGVVTVFTFITTSISNAISRYLAFELERGDKSKLRRIFSTGVIIQLIFAAILAVLIETVGMWWLNNRMELPEGRLEVARTVLHCSLGVLIINLLSVPYNAAIVAHEKMSAFAYISIGEAVLKLTVAVLLLLSSYDKLATYAFLMLAVALIVRLSYGTYCRHHFEESRGRLVFDSSLIKEMSGFAGWSSLGASAYVLNNQGVELIINSFFGVVLNAARGVAAQVENIVKQFVSNFLTALNPQITKSWAAGNKEYCFELVRKGAKFSYLVVMMFLIPLSFEAETILSLWLGPLPDQASDFAVLTLVSLLIGMTGNSLLTLKLATGDVKRYYLITGLTSLLVVPCVWLSYKLGASPVWAYIVLISIYLLVFVQKLVLVSRDTGFPIDKFMRSVMGKLLLVTALSYILPLLCYLLVPEGWLRLLLVCFGAWGSMAVATFSIALTPGERAWLLRKPLRQMPDSLFLEAQFIRSMGKPLDLKHPKTYNEKLQWLKLYDRNPLYHKLVDKVEVKRLVAEKIGDQYIIPTLGVWNHAEEIDWNSLPQSFVLKCTHDSGSTIICYDKDDFDKQAAVVQLNAALKRDFYKRMREWVYKSVTPRIIAEPLLQGTINDYKFFCFDGKPEVMFVATQRAAAEETKFDFFDMQYRHLDIRNGHPNASVTPDKPQQFEEMKALAAKLSEGIPHVRMDFYEVGGQIYFGEYTFYHWSGFVPFDPESADEWMGSLIKLPEKKWRG